MTQAQQTWGERKASRPGDRSAPAYEWVDRGGAQVLVLRSFALAHALLRLTEGTEQAGFNADFVRATSRITPPLIYQEGPTHREMRRSAARFFAPRTVTTQHESMITALADELVTGLEREGGGRLDTASFTLAMRVVAAVLGLTNSDVRGMERRLENFFLLPPPPDAPRWKHARELVVTNWRMLKFHVADVRPAIRARRAQPADDVISHLLERGQGSADILTSMLMYAAAGMVTTRHFIPMAVWHLVERPALRERFLAAEQTERLRILAEVIRLDTVAGNLLRRTTAPVRLEADGEVVEIPEGVLVDIELRPSNCDAAAFGEEPAALDPDRCPVGKAAESGLAFGAGHHSCPGEYLAMHETDIFLRRLVRNEVTITREPDIRWNDVVLAYDLYDFRITLSPPSAH